MSQEEEKGMSEEEAAAKVLSNAALSARQLNRPELSQINPLLYVPGTEFEVSNEALDINNWKRFLVVADLLSKNESLREEMLNDPVEFLKKNGVEDFQLLNRIGEKQTVSFFEIVDKMDPQDQLASILSINEMPLVQGQVMAFIGVLIFVVAVVIVKTVANVNTYANANVLANANVNANANVAGIGVVTLAGGGLGTLILPVKLPVAFTRASLYKALGDLGLSDDRKKSLLKHTVSTREFVSSLEEMEYGKYRITASRIYRGVAFKVIATVSEEEIVIESAELVESMQ